MHKRTWYTYKVIVLLIKPIVSLMFSSPSCCWIFKSLTFPVKKEEVMLFDVGITWTPMLNGKANGCSQWFLSICIIATSLEKSLVAGHRCNKHVQWNAGNTNLDNSNSPLTQTKSYFPWISLHFSVIFTWLTQTQRAVIPHQLELNFLSFDHNFKFNLITWILVPVTPLGCHFISSSCCIISETMGNKITVTVCFGAS